MSCLARGAWGKDEHRHRGVTAASYLYCSRVRVHQPCSSRDSTRPRAAAAACTLAGRQPCRWSCKARMGLSISPKHPFLRAGSPFPMDQGRIPPPPPARMGSMLQAASSPVRAAEVALAGGEVGLVHGLHVGLGVGNRAAPRPHGTDPAAEQSGWVRHCWAPRAHPALTASPPLRAPWTRQCPIHQ